MATNPFLRRFWASLTLCGVSALAIGATGTQTAGQRENRPINQQRVYVSVVDKKGAPVTTLGVTDLTIKEDGATREVLKVEPATDPMQMAILVDTSAASAAAISDLRSSIKAFAAEIWAKSPDTEIALYSFGARPTLEADYSTSPTNLNRRVERLFTVSDSGSTLIDAVIEVSGGLKKRGAARPVIVAYVDENGPEFSNRRHDKA